MPSFNFFFEMNSRIEKIKKVVFTIPYVYSFITIFILYLIINFLVNGSSETAPVLFYFNLNIVIPSLILSLLIAILTGINVNLIWLKFKEYRKINKEQGLTFFGSFIGLLGGACPGCFVGLFPAFLGLFGITASLNILPFYGLELLVISAVILIISIIFLTNNNVCKIPVRKNV